MKSATLLATAVACCVAMAAPAPSGAWEPAGAGNDVMHASGSLLTLEVPVYYGGSVYLGQMFIDCPDPELAFTYWRGQANFMSNGQLGPDDGLCFPSVSFSTLLNNCELGGTTTALGMAGNGDPGNDVIVINNGPTFGYQFQGAGCAFADDTFSVGIPDEDSCQPTYSDETGEIEFIQMVCLVTQGSMNPYIRNGDPVEIESELFVYDPVNPFPYME